MPTDLNNQLPQLQLLPANQPPHYICNYSLQDVNHMNIFKKIHSYSKILCLDRPRTSTTTLHLRSDIRSQGLPFWPKSMLFLRLQSHMHNTTARQKKDPTTTCSYLATYHRDNHFPTSQSRRGALHSVMHVQKKS